ncbi:MAG: restriction endonuclease subunit S, partial [Bacillota bacterium]|nr:restriction endonuclease subunit S [Bacillota bacterium]
MIALFSDYVTIGDIADVKGGKRLPRGMSVQDEPTAHPYIRVVDFTDDGLDRTNIKYITDSTYDKIKRYTISSEDIYISIAGTIGRVGIVPKDLSGANLTENAAKISNIDKSYDRQFLVYYLRSPQGQAEIFSKIVGTSQPKLALFRIKEIRVPKVHLPTQRKIAAILSGYDDLIENNTRRIKNLEEMAQLIYREWFVKFRFPGHEKVRMVDSELGPIPEGWEVKRLS